MAKLTTFWSVAAHRYANNETSVQYPPPFAPHHLGYYPVGNLDAAGQENMPVEETANILLMLAAAIQRQPSALELFSPHYDDLLELWASYLVSVLPDPGNQLCTDDFEGVPLSRQRNDFVLRVCSNFSWWDSIDATSATCNSRRLTMPIWLRKESWGMCVRVACTGEDRWCVLLSLTGRAGCDG